MKQLLSFLLCACLLLTVTACSGGGTTNSKLAKTEAPESSQPDTRKQPESEPGESDTSSKTGPDQSSDETTSGSNILVAYFSLAGEQYEVGVIEKGNTEIVAEMIADTTGAGTFKIESTENTPLPMTVFWTSPGKRKPILRRLRVPWRTWTITTRFS